MRIQDDTLWAELWEAIAEKRDEYPRSNLDAPTDEVVDAVFQVLSRHGLTGRPPRE